VISEKGKKDTEYGRTSCRDSEVIALFEGIMNEHTINTGHQYIIECSGSSWDGLCLNCCIESLFSLHELSETSWNKEKFHEIGNIMVNCINELYGEYDLDEIYDIIQENMIMYIQVSINYSVNYKYNIFTMASLIDSIHMENISLVRYMSWLENRFDFAVATLFKISDNLNNIDQLNSKVSIKYNIWILWYVFKSFSTYIDCINQSIHNTNTNTMKDHENQRALRSSLFSLKMITTITPLIRYGYLSGRTEEDMWLQNYFMEPDMMSDLLLFKIAAIHNISTIITTIIYKTTSSQSTSSTNPQYECDLQSLFTLYDYCLGEIIIDFNQQFKHIRTTIELSKAFLSLSPTNSSNSSNRLSDVSLLHQLNLLTIISYALQAMFMQSHHTNSTTTSSNAITRFVNTNISSLLNIASVAIAIANKGMASQQMMVMMMTQLEFSNSSMIGLQLVLSILEHADAIDHYENNNININKNISRLFNEETLDVKRALHSSHKSNPHGATIHVCLKIADILLRDDCNYSSKLFAVYEKSLQRQSDNQTARHHDDLHPHHEQHHYQVDISTIEYLLTIQNVILQSYAIISTVNPRKFFYSSNFTKHIFNTMYHHFMSSIAVHQQLLHQSAMEIRRKTIGLPPVSVHNIDRYATILNALLTILGNAIKFNGKYMNTQTILQDICNTLEACSSLSSSLMMMSHISRAIPLLFNLILTTPSIYQSITTALTDSVMQAIMNSYAQSITALLLLQQQQQQQQQRLYQQDSLDIVENSIGYAIKCMIVSEERFVQWLHHDSDKQKQICIQFHVLSNHMLTFALDSMTEEIKNNSTSQDITGRSSDGHRCDELILLVLRLHLLGQPLLFPDLFASVYRHRAYHTTLCRYVIMRISTMQDPSMIIDLYTQFLVLLFSRHIAMDSDVESMTSAIEVRAYIIDVLERHGACFQDHQALSCLLMKDLLLSCQIKDDITSVDFKAMQSDYSSDMVPKRLSLYISLCLDNKGHCLDNLLLGHHHHHHHDHYGNHKKVFQGAIQDLIALDISLSIIACPTITCCDNILAFQLILPTSMDAIKSNYNNRERLNRIEGSNSNTLEMVTANSMDRVLHSCVALQTFLLILDTVDDNHAKEVRHGVINTSLFINDETVNYWSYCSGDKHCSPSSAVMRRLLNGHTHEQVSPIMIQQIDHSDPTAVAVVESVESFVCSMFMRYIFTMIDHMTFSSINHNHLTSSSINHNHVHQRSGRLFFNMSMLPLRTVLSFNEHLAITLSLDYLELVLNMVDRLAKGIGHTTADSSVCTDTNDVDHDMRLVLSVCMSFTEQILIASGDSSNSTVTSSQYEHFPLQILQLSNDILLRFDPSYGNDLTLGDDCDRLSHRHHHHHQEEGDQSSWMSIRDTGLRIINSICICHWSTYYSLAHLDPMIFSKYW